MSFSSYKALWTVFKDYKLTKAEIKIAECLLLGYSNATIASHLGLQLNTVKIKLTPIYKKVGVTSRAQFISKYHPIVAAAQTESTVSKVVKDLESEVVRLKGRKRSADQIRNVWPEFLAATGLKDSDNRLLNALLAALKL